MASYIDSQGNYYTGEKVPGGIEVNAKPSANYKLKSDWTTQIPDVWEYDIEGAKVKLIQEAKDSFDDSHQELIFQYYPKYEPFSWVDQRQSAEDWIALEVPATEQDPTPIQSAKAQAILDLSFPWLFNACYPDGGEILISVVDTFAATIMSNASAYTQAASILLGKKRARISAINAAVTEEEIIALIE
jgi:hypothetical protein